MTASADPVSEDELNAMTKAELQQYATDNGISGVNSSRQTKAEMIATILSALE